MGFEMGGDLTTENRQARIVKRDLTTENRHLRI